MLRNFSNHFILQIGTNNLSSSETTERTTNNIIDLINSLKNDQYDANPSNIMLSVDNANLNENSQLLTEGFSTPYKLDCNLNGAGIFYMSEIIFLIYLLQQRINQ